MSRRSIMVGVAALVVSVALAGMASARSPLHGSLKIKIIRQSWNPYNPRVTNHQILHCLGGYRSTARRDWAIWYFTGYTNAGVDPGCRAAEGSGFAIVKLEHNKWTPVVEISGAEPCYLKSLPGQPKIPWAVIDDLFRIHCPTKSFGSP